MPHTKKSINAAIDDAQRVLSAGGPGPSELDGAPILNDYMFLTDGEHIWLRGVVTGHPKISDGRIATTSVLVEIDRETATWVRTASRWYRLGRAFGETEQ